MAKVADDGAGLVLQQLFLLLQPWPIMMCLPVASQISKELLNRCPMFEQSLRRVQLGNLSFEFLDQLRRLQLGAFSRTEFG